MLAQITTAQDLITLPEDTRRGFMDQAITKAKESAPYLEQARRFWLRLSEVGSISELVANVGHYQDELISAASFSEKAEGHMTREHLRAAIEAVLRQVEGSENAHWREDILYRFLLTKGDSLGGRMRNIIGAFAAVKLSTMITDTLSHQGIEYSATHTPTGKIQAVTWEARAVLFDKKPAFIGNSVDAILLDTTGSDSPLDRALIEERGRYLACGELKGGIDPAGADEHWKTARSALDRIRDSFEVQESPSLFFIGAAIEAAMAVEIFDQLQDGRLSHAANLNKQEQVADLVTWLINR